MRWMLCLLAVLMLAVTGCAPGDPSPEEIITQPVKTLSEVKKNSIFKIKIPHAMNLFKASEGRWPSDRQEFDSRILEPNQIKLPDLPEGHKYVYHPDRGELAIEPE